MPVLLVNTHSRQISSQVSQNQRECNSDNTDPFRNGSSFIVVLNVNSNNYTVMDDNQNQNIMHHNLINEIFDNNRNQYDNINDNDNDNNDEIYDDADDYDEWIQDNNYNNDNNDNIDEQDEQNMLDEFQEQLPQQSGNQQPRTRQNQNQTQRRIQTQNENTENQNTDFIPRLYTFHYEELLGYSIYSRNLHNIIDDLRETHEFTIEELRMFCYAFENRNYNDTTISQNIRDNYNTQLTAVSRHIDLMALHVSASRQHQQ